MKPMAVYVLDVDTNIKGEFSPVAPELTEALQTAFSEKHEVFNILERRHLDQLVRANQLEKDLDAISHGGTASAQFVRQIRADGFIRSELVDSPDGVVLTVTLVNLNSAVIWQAQLSESRAAWLLHDIQKRDAEKLAEEAAVRFKPSEGNPATQTQSPLSPAVQNPEGQPPSPTGAQHVPEASKAETFVTAYYRLSAGAARKDGNHLTLSITAESLSDKPIRFVVQTISCYLLDENGNRWSQSDPDSAGFSWSGVELDPGTRLKSNFTFIAKDDDTGTRYSFICPEGSPQQGRRIVIPGITPGVQ
jgi:hypothetical protein